MRAKEGSMLRTVCIAFVLLSLVSCAKPDYWIEGLTLPSGSTIVSKTVTDSTSTLPGLGSALSRTAEKVLVVTFNNGGGWDPVSTHFDSTMAALGYANVYDKASQAPTGIPDSAGFLGNVMKYSRLYGKDGSKYMVMLNSTKDALGSMGAPDVAKQGANKVGEFSLIVELLKSPAK